MYCDDHISNFSDQLDGSRVGAIHVQSDLTLFSKGTLAC
jgi:hypothetical protein